MKKANRRRGMYHADFNQVHNCNSYSGGSRIFRKRRKSDERFSRIQHRKQPGDHSESHVGFTIEIKRGPGGIAITRPLDQITFLDVYEAVEKNKDDLFHFHENTNPQCPVGKNIHSALYGKLQEVQKDFEESLKKHKLSDVVADLYREIQASSR